MMFCKGKRNGRLARRAGRLGQVAVRQGQGQRLVCGMCQEASAVSVAVVRYKLLQASSIRI